MEAILYADVQGMLADTEDSSRKEWSSSSFLSFHQESYVRQTVPSQCLRKEWYRGMAGNIIEEHMERNGLKGNAKNTEVMVCTGEGSIAADNYI